jgi:hypothetical protein
MVLRDMQSNRRQSFGALGEEDLNPKGCRQEALLTLE